MAAMAEQEVRGGGVRAERRHERLLLQRQRSERSQRSHGAKKAALAFEASLLRSLLRRGEEAEHGRAEQGESNGSHLSPGHESDQCAARLH
jgi:hypothetical protein